jgi:hypothetical protein
MSYNAIETAVSPQNISSPNYPNNYPDNTDCTSVITADTGLQIRLEFSAFQLEECNSCECDYLEVLL